MGQLCSCAAPRNKHKHKREQRLSDDEASTQGLSLSRHEEDDDADGIDGDDQIRIVIDSDGDTERAALLGPSGAAVAAAVMTKRTSKSALLRAQATATAIGAAGDMMGGTTGPEQPVDPRSAVEQRRNMDVLRSYQKATGVVDPGQADLECVMCLDTFGSENPKVRTLCNCGMNRTNFHLSCLLEWLNRNANCPVCRQYLFYEEP